jgi:hypothetical protein
MAETTKGAKAPAKPRKSATKKSSSEVEVQKKSNEVEAQKRDPSNSEIAELAQRFWAERGYQDGHAEQDWLRAEHELRNA